MFYPQYFRPSLIKRLCCRPIESIAVALALMMLSSSLIAQNSGTIVGTVTDPSGAVVVSAKAIAIEITTNLTRVAITNSQGYYVINSLRPSQYKVVIDTPGFQQIVQEGVTLKADQTLTVDMKLQVGSATQSVTVDTAPPQIDNTTGTIGQVIDQERMVDLPLNGRNAAALTTLVPGAISAPNNGAFQSSTFGNQAVGGEAAAVTISTSGSQQTSVNYLLDGSDNMDSYTNVNQPFPMPDSLQEFSVQTSDYGAQYGGNSGAVVNVVTKFGTNDFHGDLFEFVRNSDLNARNWAATTRDSIKRNQFGGTIGGPVEIPKLYNGKNNTFFFFGMQGTIFHDTSATSKEYVPTTANLNGDFSAMLSATNPANPLGRVVTIKDPVTGEPFQDNMIPTSRFDPAALNVVKLLVPSGSPSGLTSYLQPNAPQDFDEELVRIDHVLTSKDHLTGRYFRDTFNNPAIYQMGNILTYKDGQPNISQNLLVSETHIFSPSILNDFRFTRSEVDGAQNPPSNAPDYADLGVNMYQPSGIPKAIESISISGLFSFGDHPSGVFDRVNYVFDNDVKWVHGRHSIAFGGSMLYASLNVTNNFRRFGAFSFGGEATGYAMSDFLLGQVRTFTQSSGQFQNSRNTLWSLYFQDDFHVNSKLTLNMGLRYDPFRPWNEVNGRLEAFSPAGYAAGAVSQVYVNSPPGLTFPGDPGFPRGGTGATYLDVAPRFGFAYDPEGNAKTSIRGGFGMFYDARGISEITQEIVSENPFSPSLSITTLQGPFSNPYLGLTAHPPFQYPAPANFVFPLPVTALTYDPSHKYQVPLNYNYNLTVERQIGQNWSARVSYVGNDGLHIRRDEELNPGIYTPGASGIFGNPSISVTERTPYAADYSSIGELTQSGVSNYNALQAALQRRFAHMLTVLASYTWSKSLDNVPPNQVLQNGSDGAFSEPIDIPGYSQFEYGPSPFDHTQNFVLSYVWQTPKLSGAQRLVRAALGNWGWSGLMSLQTGDAETIYAGTDVAATDASPRAVLQGKPYGGNACNGVTTTCANKLNPTSFALPLAAVGTPAATYAAYPYKYGNVGKGAIRGPGLWDWDMSVYKNVGLTETAHLQFRAEAFNVFNHVNFGDPGTTLTSGGFGSIQSAADPRIGQLAMKLIF
jgi:hypothetical protein